ncbi:B12-binding domain-containing radical SAM protein [Parabacteroides sp. PF5-6]|uniref:B12-binding domain-containing radical SAM protein n=1 Tax=Parabacteroides sp. PF5-6 TaxID=1742403 RepID=UPI0024059AA3|nr:B12-binding domain-containing radical SAM protein [Parabacteroides sp. PF5-6]
MKTILTTLNAKYIHTSLALRWLYVANKDRFDLSFREYTIKERTERIAEELLALECDVVGISVSIWNVRQTRELVVALKEARPELILIVGGPEVMYEPEFFLADWPIDYVIGGEGEFVLGELLGAIQEGLSTEIRGVSSRGHIDHTIVQADIEKLALLPSPFQLEEDEIDRPHRMVYFETSRGCPYQCQYCLSSLEKGVRYFPQAYIFQNLKYLIEHGARQIKFLDRTFNLNREHTEGVFQFLIANHRTGLSCQFEVYADLLHDALIDYLNTALPTGFFRFEIGIQSTYEPTNRAVRRKQNFELLARNIRRIMDGGRIDLHLDLIAGLPYESFDRFRQSFNEVFALGAKEVQLGFLKMLRGTNLRRDADRYGYVYQAEAPYEIVCNADISAAELARIHQAEQMLDKYWNSGRFRQTMAVVFADHYAGRYFEFFDELGVFYHSNNYPYHGYQLEDLFRFLYHFLQSKAIDLLLPLRRDFYSHFSRRPKGFWPELLDKKKRKQLLYAIAQDQAFLQEHKLNREIIEKHTAIDPSPNGGYWLTCFLTEGNRELYIEWLGVMK